MSNEQAWEVLLHGYLQMVSLSFLYWDHLITIDDELRLLWNKPKTLASYLFFVNRYLAFFGNITVLTLEFTTLSITGELCDNYALYRQILLVTSQIVVCSIKVLMYMLGSGVILFAVSCWSLTDQKSDQWKDSGIVSSLGVLINSRPDVASAWEALFIYDSMLFVFTFYRAYKHRTENIPLVYLVFRDGTSAVSDGRVGELMNRCRIYLLCPYLRGGLSSCASSLSVTLMSRVTLNLHQTRDVGIFSDVSAATREEEVTHELDTLPLSGFRRTDSEEFTA
ncbi:hypothetical protein IW261DRAFT_1466651 [Armillaria novae-zelandiae]|uniref:DUF6533 domain-containing protein n=1 Tax=Armillaria novae-zelandiae TaxID=153914 RepID=A0AA39PE56_9AGAR|nr:hypothetical protein IW261DRAFT_1466651 [Armillaria novae-zelandiae]